MSKSKVELLYVIEPEDYINVDSVWEREGPSVEMVKRLLIILSINIFVIIFFRVSSEDKPEKDLCENEEAHQMTREEGAFQETRKCKEAKIKLSFVKNECTGMQIWGGTARHHFFQNDEC